MPLTSLSGLSALSTFEESESELGSSSYTGRRIIISKKYNITVMRIDYLTVEGKILEIVYCFKA